MPLIGAGMAQLKADIIKTVADATELADQIAQHCADIAARTSEKGQAEAIRAKVNADYKVVRSDYASAIDSVERAKKTLAAQPAAIGQAASLFRSR